MKITAVKYQVKNPERASIFIDGKYSFSLDLGEVLSEKIKSGQRIDDTRLKRLKKISSDGKLKNQALFWILSRPHSERELRDYLRRKKAGDQLVTKIVKIFQDKGYQDDKKFALWLVEVRTKKLKSNRAIRSELYSKGVSNEVVESVLEGSDDEHSRIRELVEKKRRNSKYQKDELKLTKYLTSQGFSYSQVREVLKKSD